MCRLLRRHDGPPQLLHFVVVTAKLCGRGGVRAVIAENLVLKQQLIVLRRGRQRAPNLTRGDRLICGFGSLFLSCPSPNHRGMPPMPPERML